MATILSNNYNGKVIVTANAGFSVKKSVSKIEKEITKIGMSIEKDIAKTGTTYISLFDSLDVFIVEIRVSNHSKRGNLELNTFEYTTDRFGKKVIEVVNVCNSNMLKEFLQNIPTSN
jgi:hypothetical protein